MKKNNQPILLELPYLGNIQFFSKVLFHKEIIIESKDNYQKGTYRNRCHILTGNGLSRLTIPLQKGKNNQLNIREVKISYDTPWQKQHWKSIQCAYGKAPFFEYYADEIQPYFEKKYEYLFDFNLELFYLFDELLNLNNTLSFTSTYEVTPSEDILDFRNKILPNGRTPDPYFQAEPYPQVFKERFGFVENLCILDGLFCLGPEIILKIRDAYRFKEF